MTRSGACQAEGAFADCMPSFAVAHGSPGPNAVGAPTGARTIWTRVEHFLVALVHVPYRGRPLREIACENCLVCTTSVKMYVVL